jgi:hypothetical protein
LQLLSHSSKPVRIALYTADQYVQHSKGPFAENQPDKKKNNAFI